MLPDFGGDKISVEIGGTVSSDAVEELWTGDQASILSETAA